MKKLFRDTSLLSCDIMYSDGELPMFWRTPSLHLQCGGISNAVRISDLTKYFMAYYRCQFYCVPEYSRCITWMACFCQVLLWQLLCSKMRQILCINHTVDQMVTCYPASDKDEVQSHNSPFHIFCKPK